MAEPPGFEVRAVQVEPAEALPYDEEEWRDAIVVVTSGEIELECLGGNRPRFGCGSVLWLVGLPVRAIHNYGLEPAVLVAVSRRAVTGR